MYIGNKLNLILYTIKMIIFNNYLDAVEILWSGLKFWCYSKGAKRVDAEALLHGSFPAQHICWIKSCT